MSSFKKGYILFAVIILGMLMVILSLQEKTTEEKDKNYLRESFRKEMEEMVLENLVPYLWYRRNNDGITDYSGEEEKAKEKTKELASALYYLDLGEIEKTDNNRDQGLVKDREERIEGRIEERTEEEGAYEAGEEKKGEAPIEETKENATGAPKQQDPQEEETGHENTQQESKEQENTEAEKPEVGKPEVEGNRRKKQCQINAEDYAEYDKLINTFYTMDASTYIGPDYLNYQNLMEKDWRIDKQTEGPQILIYHTHSQEGFADSVSGDDSTTIVSVGERLKEILEEEYGYKVYHHLGKYDVETRDNAYNRSIDDLEKILAQNPQIQVILDIHRDDMDEGTHLVTEVDGKPTAKFMFFNGVSRTRKNGEIGYLYNPYLQDNLSFSFQAKVLAQEYYPGLTRRNYLHAYRYNLHLLPRSMLIEVGAQNNTLAEELNACEPLAHILDMVLSGENQ